MSQTRPLSTLYGNDCESDALRAAFRDGDVPVAVYGLGKMGLPLAAVYATVCGNVLGADVDPNVVETINAGDCHVKREPGLDELVADVVSEGSLRAVSAPRTAAERASVHVVIVPTPISDDHEPDLSTLDSVIADIGSELAEGDLVLVESTVPPRTCEDRVLPRLVEESDISGETFGLAFCPERTSSGRALEDIRGAYPKVVGGVDDESTRVAELVYEEITDRGVITVPDATTAEAVKVFEGVYRDVNIALANQLATYVDALGIDVNEAIDAANTQPYCDIHAPGPGVGGHCIPFYPYFLTEPFDVDAHLLRTARRVNDEMPEFTVGRLQAEFAAEGTPMSETTVLVLGLTYRPGVEETTATPALGICERLDELGASVYGVDPLIESFDPFPVTPLSLDEIYEIEFDGVVVVTPHEEFDGIDWESLERVGDDPLVVIDGRRALDIEDADHRVYTIGGGYDV